MTHQLTQHAGILCHDVQGQHQRLEFSHPSCEVVVAKCFETLRQNLRRYDVTAGSRQQIGGRPGGGGRTAAGARTPQNMEAAGNDLLMRMFCSAVNSSAENVGAFWKPWTCCSLLRALLLVLPALGSTSSSGVSRGQLPAEANLLNNNRQLARSHISKNLLTDA
jgi:hypothetical protein